MTFDPSSPSTGNEAREKQIFGWMDEFALASTSSQQTLLAAELSSALEGFMGIERDMLMSTLLVQANWNLQNR